MDAAPSALIAALDGHQVLGLDTSVFIYHFEGHLRHQLLTSALLTAVQRGECQAVASVLAIMEVTVRPWQLDQPAVACEYEMLLVNFPHLTVIDVNRDIARRAAKLRATYRLRPADALHLASALQHGATAFVTNDRGFRRVHRDITVLVLDDFLDRGK
ncbi:MAG: type II toxin-antitoxin system VapC family toxin [Chloroflexota bacterium]|nr:type II toxin-antitoxin system VapC family toxin [Chloroflexota bacterium]